MAFGASLRIGLGDTQTLTKFRDSLNVEQIGDNWHWKYILGPTGTQEEIDQIKTEALTKLKRLQDDMVNDERARRILVGKDFNGIYLKGDQVNRDNLDSLACRISSIQPSVLQPWEASGS